jgi:hypothetical protein
MNANALCIFSVGEAIYNTLSSNNIKILSSMNVQPGYTNADISFILESIKKSDARYIIISGRNQMTADFVMGAKNYSLFGPDYVWMGINTPSPSGGGVEEGEGCFF